MEGLPSRIHLVALICGALTLAAGCDESEPSFAAMDAGAEAGECKPAPGRYEEGRDPPAYCVKEVEGILGVPAEGAPAAVSVCGTACFFGEIGEGGRFRVRVSSRLPDDGYVLFAHGRPRLASVLVRLPKAPPELLDLGRIELVDLSMTAGAIPPDGAASYELAAGPVTFAVADGTSWDLVFEDAADELEGRNLRLAKVAVDRAPAFAKGAALVYAVAPFQAKASKPVALRISESGGLAPNAEVDIAVMRPLDVALENRGGLPEVVAKAHVSADGLSITTDPGEGISVLTWIAVMPR